MRREEGRGLGRRATERRSRPKKEREVKIKERGWVRDDEAKGKRVGQGR